MFYLVDDKHLENKAEDKLSVLHRTTRTCGERWLVFIIQQRYRVSVRATLGGQMPD